ncbi:hypothetical protein H5410_061796, partial [Solanum commersonii]
PHPSENPNPNIITSIPPPPIETPILTITTNISPLPPNDPEEQDLDTGPLSLQHQQVSSTSSRTNGPLMSLLNDLHATRAQTVIFQAKLETLRIDLDVSQGEVVRLKDQLLQQQLESNTRVDRVLQLLALSQPLSQPSPSTS